VPNVRLPPIRSRHFYSAVLALGVVGAGFAAWEAYRVHAVSLMVIVVASFILLVLGLTGIWLDPITDDSDERASRRLLLSPKRLKRLERVAEFLPDPPPLGWKPFFSPAGLSASWLSVADGIVVVAWVLPDDVGYRLHVALVPKDNRPIPHDRAAEILAHFRGVGRFAELAQSPEPIAKEYPTVRTWIALSYEAIAALARPARSPEVIDGPLNEHLAAARKHLPAKLPDDWSVPLAITEPHEGWTDGAWLIADDDVNFIACLVTSRGRVKLAVTIFHPDGVAVNDARAYSVLEHFRGIREFVSTEGAKEIPGARMYLGEIDAMEEPALLN
jgi:hypothetical protein